jgi:hypothetical protein
LFQAMLVSAILKEHNELARKVLIFFGQRTLGVLFKRHLFIRTKVNHRLRSFRRGLIPHFPREGGTHLAAARTCIGRR